MFSSAVRQCWLGDKKGIQPVKDDYLKGSLSGIRPKLDLLQTIIIAELDLLQTIIIAQLDLLQTIIIAELDLLQKSRPVNHKLRASVFMAYLSGWHPLASLGHPQQISLHSSSGR